jgi:hypothetical protein
MPCVVNLSVVFYCYAESRTAECNYAECHYAKCHYAKCHYAKCHFLIVIILIVIMLRVMLPSVIMLIATILIVIMLRVILPSVIMLIVTAPQVNPFQATRIQAYFRAEPRTHHFSYSAGSDADVMAGNGSTSID